MNVVNGERHYVFLFLRRSRFLITAPLRESLPEALALHNIPHAGMEALCGQAMGWPQSVGVKQ